MEIAEILKTAYEVFDNGDVSVEVDSRDLGMAYAIPKGLEDTAVETYSPWHQAEIRQVFYRESAIVGSVMVELQLIMSWKYNESQQYIVDVYLDKHVISIDPTVSLKVTVRFDRPTLYDSILEAYEISFSVLIDYDPVGGNESVVLRGVVRANGTAEFHPEG